MKIEVICTGDEILTGKTVNTNYSYIARRLQESGFNVVQGTVVGDDREALQRSFIEAGARADVVIVNGGLGPTSDDLSQEVAAQVMGVGLELNEEWLNHIDAWYASRGRKMPSSNQKQAMLPMEAELIDNPVGTACGFVVKIGQANFFFTPGVPMEMRRMVEDQLIGWLDKLSGEPKVVKVKRFHTFGLGESRAEMMLKGVEEMALRQGVKLGYQSHYPQLEIKLTGQSINESVLDSTMAPIEQALRHQLGDFTVAEDDQTIEGEIMKMLDREFGSIAVLEMMTAGTVTGRLLHDGDKVALLRHGTVVTGQEGLARYYGVVPDDHDMDCALAIEVAQNYRQQLDAKYGLVVLTRWRDRDGEVKLVGEGGLDVLIGIADERQGVARKGKFPGSLKWAKLGATELALDCFRRYLKGLPIEDKTDFEQH